MKEVVHISVTRSVIRNIGYAIRGVGSAADVLCIRPLQAMLSRLRRLLTPNTKDTVHVLIFFENCVLILQREDGTWELPKGQVTINEDPKKAARFHMGKLTGVNRYPVFPLGFRQYGEWSLLRDPAPFKMWIHDFPYPCDYLYCTKVGAHRVSQGIKLKRHQAHFWRSCTNLPEEFSPLHADIIMRFTDKGGIRTWENS